jgi:hypothetical protein
MAEQFDDTLREPGFGAAAVFASAANAGVDPRILRPLVPAALALTDGDARRSFWDKLPPCPDGGTFVTWAEELEAHLTVLLRQCEGYGRAARREYDSAAEARHRAGERIAEAQGAMADPERRDAAGALMRQAREEAAEAALVTADCETALEVLGRADGKARFARDLVRSLPDGLAEVYEAAIRLTASGGKLPHSGDFIAPGGTPETITGRGAA